MKEADLKCVVSDYLQLKMNAGELYFDRLNSGSAFVGTPQHPRRINLCREGTADFMVLRLRHFDIYDKMPWPATTVIFLELKSTKGKQRPEQVAFQKLVEEQGASYHIVRSIGELRNILET